MRTHHRLRSEPLMRKRGDLASLSPEARAQLVAIVDFRSTRYAAKVLGCSDATIAILREPYGTASPKTIERITKRLSEVLGPWTVTMGPY
jgi:hypothetical protein